MKPSLLKKKQRLEAEQRRKRDLQKRNKTFDPKKPFEKIDFRYQPGTLLQQPHTWLFYRLYKRSLKDRFNEFARLEIQCRPVFPKFCETVYKEYLVEFRLRYQFKRLLNAWLIQRMNKKSSDLIDPITLNPIMKPIYVYDTKHRRRYIFEADSLNKAIKKNLYAHQYTVPSPRKPMNILTNKPFTYVQLIGIYDQMLSTRCRIEDFSALRKWQFRLETWKLYMYNQIYLMAIKEELYNYQSADGKDMLEDFIKDMIVIIKITITELFELVVTNAVNWYPEHPLLEQFRALCVSSYESNIYQLNTGLLLTARFTQLFQPNYPKCALWDQVLDRMKADSDAEKALEDEDVAMGR